MTPQAQSNPESGAVTASAAKKVPTERAQFRSLVLLNPNYFGNLKVSPFAPVLNIVGDTSFEELGGVGFQPQFNRLDAVVYIRQPIGYGGGLCTNGTPEYVRFYISFDNGATWQDQGLTSFTAHDIPAASPNSPLEYAVSLQVSPPKTFCFAANLLLARAILSWDVPPPPNDPNFTPVWGDVHDTNIQVDNLKFIIFSELATALKVQVPEKLAQYVDLNQPLPAPKPKPFSAAELQALYKGKGVQPHRFALTALQQAAGPSVSAQSLMAAGSQGALQGIEISPAEIAKLFPVDGDTQYEQLETVGFNQAQNLLIGVIRVKLPNGYSGGLCTAGSHEFVTFWADFDNSGSFATCLGTTSVNVHDIQQIPKQGLEYSVFLPTDFSAYVQPCESGARVVPIRAILSWQVPPPCADPNYVPVWGNRLQTHIQLLPGVATTAQVPFLSSLGDIPESNIDATGVANGTGIITGFPAVQSPFGGQITIGGHISNPTPGLKYRVVRKPHGAPDSAYAPVTDEPTGLVLTINTWDPINGWVQTTQTFHADAGGYYPFEDYSSTHSVESNVMMRWYSTAADDGLAFDVRIDLSVDGDPAHDVHSNVVTALIDNTPPTALLDINLGGGVECADFSPGAIFTGTYTATDLHFKEFSFVIRPAGPAHGVLPSPTSGLSTAYVGGTIADPGVSGATYTMNTAGMDPCGYALTLQVWDRTNVNSGQGNNYNEASVGFCIQIPPVA